MTKTGIIQKIFFYFCIIIFLQSIVYASKKHFDKPQNGFVPDEKTAIKIAEAVWIPIYGEEKVESEKPFTAVLKNNIWIVEGSLPKGYTLGGVLIAEISKHDGRILRVSHGK